MHENAFPVLIAPWNGADVMVKVRCLNQTQIRACGAISLIQAEDKAEEISFEQICTIKNNQEKVLQASLISPTFEEIVDYVYGDDQAIKEKREVVEALRKKIKDLPESDEKAELENDIDTQELFLGYLLPEDFMGFVTAWALGIDRTDIKKVSRDMLLEAAFHALRGHDNPADHLSGNFSDFNKEDINGRAWQIYDEFLEDAKKRKGIQGYRFIGGKNRGD